MRFSLCTLPVVVAASLAFATGCGKDAAELYLNNASHEIPKINGQYLDYECPTFDSPFLKGETGSGIVTLTGQGLDSPGNFRALIGTQVQDLVEQDGVETVGRKGQAREVALDDLYAVGRYVLQLGPRDAQHGKALVERDDMVGAGSEKLGHAAGAGPDVEQAAKAALAQRIGERAQDRPVFTRIAGREDRLVGHLFDPLLLYSRS